MACKQPLPSLAPSAGLREVTGRAKRPRDPDQLAQAIIDITTSERPD